MNMAVQTLFLKQKEVMHTLEHSDKTLWLLGWCFCCLTQQSVCLCLSSLDIHNKYHSEGRRCHLMVHFHHPLWRGRSKGAAGKKLSQYCKADLKRSKSVFHVQTHRDLGAAQTDKTALWSFPPCWLYNEVCKVTRNLFLKIQIKVKIKTGASFRHICLRCEHTTQFKSQMIPVFCSLRLWRLCSEKPAWTAVILYEGLFVFHTASRWIEVITHFFFWT